METILSIAGKPGLYKLVSRGNRNLIVEMLDESYKRMPAYAVENFPQWHLISICIHSDVAKACYAICSESKKEEGKVSSFNYKKASAEELHSYFAEVLPSYDRDRVRDSDIKKLLQWYNIMAKYGITDFKATLSPTEGDNVDDRAEQE